jgi:hypothetical protein
MIMFRRSLWSVAAVVGVLAGSQSVLAQGRPPVFVPPIPVLPQQPNWNLRPLTPLPDLRPTLPVTYPVPVVQPVQPVAVPVRAQPVAVPARPIRY